MQPLDTYNLVLNYVILIMMPLLIWANLRMNPNANPVSAYLWNEHPNFMRISLVVIGLLVALLRREPARALRGPVGRRRRCRQHRDRHSLPVPGDR